jgi:hypothetical protein
VSTSSLPTEVDVDAVAAAVVASPSVARLVGEGIGAQVATYLPGRRVEGVRVTPEDVEVHVATRWDVPIPLAAADVRAAVLPLAGGRLVTIVVEDIDEPQPAIPETTSVAHDASAIAMGTSGSGGPPPPDAVPSPS